MCSHIACCIPCHSGSASRVPGRLAKTKGPRGSFSTLKDALCPETWHGCQFTGSPASGRDAGFLQLFYFYLTCCIPKRVHQIRRVGGAALKLCPSCGGHCRAIVQEKVEKKRKSRLGSWLGKVTGKMTDRLMRTRVW